MQYFTINWMLQYMYLFETNSRSKHLNNKLLKMQDMQSLMCTLKITAYVVKQRDSG